jgi:hypothetical protein
METNQTQICPTCPECGQPTSYDAGSLRMRILPHFYCSDDMIWSDGTSEPMLWTEDGEDWLLRRDF